MKRKINVFIKNIGLTIIILSLLFLNSSFSSFNVTRRLCVSGNMVIHDVDSLIFWIYGIKTEDKIGLSLKVKLLFSKYNREIIKKNREEISKKIQQIYREEIKRKKYRNLKITNFRYDLVCELNSYLYKEYKINPNNNYLTVRTEIKVNFWDSIYLYYKKN